jgi:cell division protease FtsH
MKKLKQKSPMQGGPRNLVIAVIVVVGCLFVLTKLTDYTRQIQSISYSSFLKRVDQGDVKSVHITGQHVEGLFKNGERFEAVIAQNPSLWDSLQQHNVEFSVDTPSNVWYLSFIGTLFLMLLLIAWYTLRQIKSAGSSGGSGGNLFSMGKSKAKLFMPSTIKVTFDQVAGVPEAKEELQDVVDFLKNPTKYQRLGAKITRGVLLVGEPGNGKTLLAKAVAGEANCPFFSISGSDFIEVFVGVGAARVRDLFAQARKQAPSIIFIDEIDAVGRHRGSGLGGGHDEREQTLNQLLTEMDGFQTTGGSVIVLAATNRPDVLDKALLRPGRFDRTVFVPFPDLISREQILRVHAKDIKLDPSVDLHKIARGTPGFSGADLANLLNEAAIMASKNDQELVTMRDIDQARDKAILGKENKTMRQTPEDLKITAFHEAGHALIRLLVPTDTDPLYKVTIVPRGKALGVTHFLPEREKYHQTKDELIASIMGALGGRAAEELVFNKMTTGAGSDFQSATQIAHAMVCAYGMSDLGPVVYNHSHKSLDYSAKTASLIDEEVRKILTSNYERVLQMLKEHRDKLDKLAHALFEKETLYAAEIYELLDIEPRMTHQLV